MSQPPTIMLSAAEASADAHAAALIDALRRRLGEVRFVGIGGDRMKAAGCELIAETVGRAAMATSALRQLAYYWGLIRRVARAMDEFRPHVLVPVDSPALNWHLAKAARRRRRGIPVAYYIAPQVWAWAPWRVRKLRRLTDVVACILPFEQPYLRRRGVNAHYVGHPLFDTLAAPDPPDLAAAAHSGRWRIAMLPGSRNAEIAAHTPALVEVMAALSRLYPDAQFGFAALDENAAAAIRRAGRRDDLPVEVGSAAAVLARSHFAFVASGTATLLAAHFGVPMVVFYRVGRLSSALLGRLLLRTRRLSLVNILAGCELVPELIPWHGSAAKLLDRSQEMLGDAEGLLRTRRQLLELVGPLRAAAPNTAADNAAELVIRAMGRPRQ